MCLEGAISKETVQAQLSRGQRAAGKHFVNLLFKTLKKGKVRTHKTQGKNGFGILEPSRQLILNSSKEKLKKVCPNRPLFSF